jgi:hypothetical protein
MKLVKEHIYEKFIEDSDPIKDLGIGIEEKLKPHSLDKLKGTTPHSTRICIDISELFDLPLSKIYLLGYFINSVTIDSRTYNLLVDKKTKLIKELKKEISGNGNDLTLYQTPYGMIMTEKNFSINVWGDINAAAYVLFNDVNEKFIADSDPISDLGIGVFTKKTFSTPEEAAKWVFRILPVILKTNEIPKNILNRVGEYFGSSYWNEIEEYYMSYINIIPHDMMDFKRFHTELVKLCKNNK